MQEDKWLIKIKDIYNDNKLLGYINPFILLNEDKEMWLEAENNLHASGLEGLAIPPLNCNWTSMGTFDKMCTRVFQSKMLSFLLDHLRIEDYSYVLLPSKLEIKWNSKRNCVSILSQEYHADILIISLAISVILGLFKHGIQIEKRKGLSEWEELNSDISKGDLLLAEIAVLSSMIEDKVVMISLHSNNDIVLSTENGEWELV